MRSFFLAKLVRTGYKAFLLEKSSSLGSCEDHSEYGVGASGFSISSLSFVVFSSSSAFLSVCFDFCHDSLNV